MADDFIPFGGAEVQIADREGAAIVVLPLCYEKSPSYGQGSGQGPFYILQASEQLEMIDEESFTEWSRLNIHTARPIFPPADPARAVEAMKAAARAVLDKDKFLLCLGGDHAIAIGPILAAAERYPDMGVLQVDAHADLRDAWNGSRYNHACVMRRVLEEARVSITQVGIRSFSPEELAFIQSRRLRPFFAHELDPTDPSWIGEVVHSLPERVYITLDLDGLDPSVIPGTGTPEPGGLSYRQAVALIRAVGREKHVVAADINELAKIPGTQVSEFTAAKLATKFFVYCA